MLKPVTCDDSKPTNDPPLVPDSCVAKKKCFAPAALYKPFGEQAAGVHSLAQFQALQDGEKELADLRELGLTDSEIELWRNRDVQGGGGKVRVQPDVPSRRIRMLNEHLTTSVPDTFFGIARMNYSPRGMIFIQVVIRTQRPVLL